MVYSTKLISLSIIFMVAPNGQLQPLTAIGKQCCKEHAVIQFGENILDLV